MHPLYAESFSDIGEPLYLPRAKGWLIKRPIPNTPLFDAMGPYPLFFCKNWNCLIEDIESIKDQVCTVALVIGPFEDIPKEAFKHHFDIFRSYKDHYILDTTLPYCEIISKSHKREARKALNKIKIDLQISPNIDLDEWCFLYNTLIQHHHITGIRAFSRNTLKNHITIPNTHYYRALCHGEIIGGNLFYIQNEIAYYHLACSTEKGYKLHANYATLWSAIRDLSTKVHFIEFGGGAGAKEGILDGLSQFKKGWSSLTKKSFFLGKINDHQEYWDLIKMNRISDNNWFPAYRTGDYQ